MSLIQSACLVLCMIFKLIGKESFGFIFYFIFYKMRSFLMPILSMLLHMHIKWEAILRGWSETKLYNTTSDHPTDDPRSSP